MKMSLFFLSIKSEIKSYSRKDILFLVFAMICNFFITTEYAITKPASNSIFISHYGVKLYPYVWLATMPVNLLVVVLYNNFLHRYGCFVMLLLNVITTLIINVISGFFVKDLPWLSFLLYLWKDINVLLMFQQLWSIIHTKTRLNRAKYLYGILFGVGGLGSIFGSAIPSFLAVKVGSESLLFYTVPVYIFLSLSYYFMLKQVGFIKIIKLNNSSSKPLQSIKLISSSYSLKFILLIVIFMQLSTTIIDYQFNVFLSKEFTIQDLRTQFYGEIYALVNFCKLFLEFFLTFLLIKYIGFFNIHLMVPMVLLINSVMFMLLPTFRMMTYSFSTIKIFDYSIFNIIKEMLYVPLKQDEKFKAKAIIDIFAYRSSKAIASIFVICVQLFSPIHLQYIFSLGPLILFISWVILVLFLKRSIREKYIEV